MHAPLPPLSSSAFFCFLSPPPCPLLHPLLQETYDTIPRPLDAGVGGAEKAEVEAYNTLLETKRLEEIQLMFMQLVNVSTDPVDDIQVRRGGGEGERREEGRETS